MKKSTTTKVFSRLALAALLCTSVGLASNACAAGSIQGLGGWWEAGDSGDTYGLGLRGTFGSGPLNIDLGWMSYGEGDEIVLDEFDYSKQLGGIKANVFDLGVRHTTPAELYFGGGLSYFDFDHDVESVDGEWGVYGLVGWSFGGQYVRGFIEGMYRYTEGTIKYDDGFDGSRERSIDHDGLGANVGIMYRF